MDDLMIGLLGLLSLLVSLLGLALSCIFPLLMIALIALIGFSLVDCINHEPDENNSKIMWVIIILMGGPFGAPYYWFVRRPKRQMERGN